MIDNSPTVTVIDTDSGSESVFQIMAEVLTGETPNSPQAEATRVTRNICDLAAELPFLPDVPICLSSASVRASADDIKLSNEFIDKIQRELYDHWYRAFLTFHSSDLQLRIILAETIGIVELTSKASGFVFKAEYHQLERPNRSVIFFESTGGDDDRNSYSPTSVDIFILLAIKDELEKHIPPKI
jgi:hypothetical protein